MASGLREGLTSYGDAGFSLFLRKAFIKAAGYSDDALDRPIVGITDTASDFNPCHGNAPQLIEAVRRGVMLAGGLPMSFPTISIHEAFAHPTSMYLRNLMAMDTEEMVRAQPMDAVVLVGGCDKTLPAQIMGAVSAGTPAVPPVAYRSGPLSPSFSTMGSAPARGASAGLSGSPSVRLKCRPAAAGLPASAVAAVAQRGAVTRQLKALILCCAASARMPSSTAAFRP